MEQKRGEERGEKERMEQKLYRAAIEGSVNKLHEILGEDGFILDRVDHAGRFNTTPLHAAASRGHLDFVRELLRRNPDLADVVDSQKRLALHLASAKGHVEVVKELVLADREVTCTARDLYGRNPLHLAAIKGRVDVLEELVRASPSAARAREDQGETILHLCVQYHQLETLKLLMGKFGRDFINAKDNGGNTILHLAVVSQNYEIVKHIVESPKVDVNAANLGGYTALDIALQSETERVENDEITIKDILRDAGAERGRDLVQGEWLTKKRDALMVVAILIATMAFQAGVNPPGGVWQSDESNTTMAIEAGVSPSPSGVFQGNESSHRAGETVMAYNYPHYYPYFLRANTIGFVASLSIILLLITGLPFKKRGFMWVLVVIMWLTISSMAFTYAFSIVVITPKKDRDPLSSTIVVGVIAWCSVMAILLIFHTVRLVAKILEERKIKSMASTKIFNCGSFCSKPISGSDHV